MRKGVGTSEGQKAAHEGATMVVILYLVNACARIGSLFIIGLLPPSSYKLHDTALPLATGTSHALN